VRTFFAVRKKYSALEILLEREFIWNLKLSRGSIKIPRNFTAGVGDSVVILSSGLIKFKSGMPSSLLKLR